jgi:four helix bundle protein
MTKSQPKNGTRVFDLEERTARFGEAVLAFARTLCADAVMRPLISQLVRSGTSVGANYSEADEASSRKDFRYRIALCKREVKETKHWLRMISTAAPDSKGQARNLWREARELQLILASIHRKSARES